MHQSHVHGPQSQVWGQRRTGSQIPTDIYITIQDKQHSANVRLSIKFSPHPFSEGQQIATCFCQYVGCCGQGPIAKDLYQPIQKIYDDYYYVGQWDFANAKW